MTTLVVLTVVEIVVLIAGLAYFLYRIGTLLRSIARNLEESSELVKKVNEDVAAIVPGLEHLNRTGGVVASTLPLLYTAAEKIVATASRRSRPHQTLPMR